MPSEYGSEVAFADYTRSRPTSIPVFCSQNSSSLSRLHSIVWVDVGKKSTMLYSNCLYYVYRIIPAWRYLPILLLYWSIDRQQRYAQNAATENLWSVLCKNRKQSVASLISKCVNHPRHPMCWHALSLDLTRDQVPARLPVFVLYCLELLLFLH